MIIIILMYGLCAASFTLCKAGLDYCPALLFVAIRMLLAALILLSYQIITYGFKGIVSHHWWYYIQIIVFHIYLPYSLELWSMNYLSSIQTAFIYNISPLMAALFSYLYNKEILSYKKWLALVIGILGFLPQLYSLSSEAQVIQHSFAVLGLLCSIASSMYGWTVMNHMINVHSYSPLALNGIAMLAGGIIALISSAYFECWDLLALSSTHFVLISLGLAIGMNVIFYNMYGYLLKRYSSTLLSFFGFITPCIASIFGFIFLSETMHVCMLISLCIVCLGLYIFYQDEIKTAQLSPKNI